MVGYFIDFTLTLLKNKIMTKPYVLGTDSIELKRLARQHELWRDYLFETIQELPTSPIKKIVDLGCGPGFISQDLHRHYKGRKEIHSVDRSLEFLEFAKKKTPALHIHEQDLTSLNLDSNDFDLAVSRWVLIFIQNYEQVIKRVHQHLKKKGIWVLQEYVAYETMSLSPNSKALEKIVQAIFRSWDKEGGDPNRGKILPAILEKNGFRIKHLDSKSRIAIPSDPLWDWPDQFFNSYIPKLVKRGEITSGTEKEFWEDWKAAKKTPGSFFLAPTMMTIVAEKG